MPVVGTPFRARRPPKRRGLRQGVPLRQSSRLKLVDPLVLLGMICLLRSSSNPANTPSQTDHLKRESYRGALFRVRLLHVLVHHQPSKSNQLVLSDRVCRQHLHWPSDYDQAHWMSLLARHT